MNASDISVNNVLKRIGLVALSVLMIEAVVMMQGVETAQAAIDVYEFQNEQQEAQFKTLIEELRCPKCQNQNVADSNAMIAVDIKDRVYEWVQAGRTSAEITSELVDRYGNFVTYRPPMNESTMLLWIGPPLIFVVAIPVIVWRVRRKTPLVEGRKTREHEVENLLTEIKTESNKS